jgi:hypothetical protein
MKKHTFILFVSLILLVVAEYFFFTEVYSARRPAVLAITILAGIGCLSIAIRAFKLIFRNSAD